MKTTELRIGNYVNGIYDEGEFIAEVLTVDSEGCLLDANGIYELTSSGDWYYDVTPTFWRR